jgi:GNAT superfamily N-acetyltransferase
MALVHGDDVDEFDEVMATIADVGVPALLMFTGSGLPFVERAPPGWAHVGVMPFMIADVASTPQRLDARVRRAVAADGEALLGLWADAFGMRPEHAQPIVEAIVSDPKPGAGAWILEQDGVAVSTVTTATVGDAITVWSMATPERFTRRGYARVLLADAMARAAAAGVSVGLLGATPAGKPLYDATGWTTIEDWQIYTNTESAQFD